MVDEQNEETPSTCSICSVDPPVVECSGDQPHGFCHDCFKGYAKTNFEHNGEYERERDRDGLVSEVGQLPCPHFIQGSCFCTEISPSLLRRFVDDETFEMWRKADLRIGISRQESEQKEALARREQAEEERTPLDNLRDAVHEIFTKGATVCCPQCTAKGEKDDQCMHIKCQSCRTEWCYCCGRRRGNQPRFCNRESGCDANSPYLENEPGWGDFAIGDESAGQGALHEFHRRRMVYFLRQLKQSTDDGLWNDFQTANPNILRNVPTARRRISWHEIDGAQIPTFGNTPPEDVQWAEEGREILANLEERRRVALEDIELQQCRETLLQRRFADYVTNRVDRFICILVLCNFLFLFALITATAVVQDEVARVCLASLLCCYLTVLLYGIISIGIDWRYNTLLDVDDRWSLPTAEVQFCGSRDEVPYLSAVGRWKRTRGIYLLVLLLTMTFGSFLTAFFQSWSETRCIEYYGVCGLGPAFLVFCGTVFGGGTFLVNLSPPPTSSPPRKQRFRLNMMCLFLFGGIMIPVGTYLMVGFKQLLKVHIFWLVGATMIGASVTAIFGDLSARLFNPRGFALDRGGFLPSKVHAAFWAFVVLGVFLLATADGVRVRLIFGAGLVVSPVLLALLYRVYSLPR